jgi:hypothetical protein
MKKFKEKVCQLTSLKKVNRPYVQTVLILLLVLRLVDTVLRMHDK